VIAVVAALVALTRQRSPKPPAVNASQARAMLPVIEAYLDSPAAGNRGGLLAAIRPKLHPRTFCTAVIVEIRPDGPRWLAGMQADCGEYARQGRKLLEGTEEGNPVVMVLSARAGHYHVVTSTPDRSDGYDAGWIDRHFSPGAAVEIDHDQPTPPDPAVLARRALGLPPGARAQTP
jgi:hypothetical protein